MAEQWDLLFTLAIQLLHAKRTNGARAINEREYDSRVQNDPQIPLNCAVCGTRLLYVKSSASDDSLETYHYKCPNNCCRLQWKIVPEGRLETDNQILN